MNIYYILSKYFPKPVFFKKKGMQCYIKTLRAVFVTLPSFHVKERRNSGLCLGCNGIRHLLLFELSVPLQLDFESHINYILIMYLIL